VVPHPTVGLWGPLTPSVLGHLHLLHSAPQPHQCPGLSWDSASLAASRPQQEPGRGQTETERQRERETEQRKRDTEREREREKQTQTQREKGREKGEHSGQDWLEVGHLSTMCKALGSSPRTAK
jgi:hypothetical protein